MSYVQGFLVPVRTARKEAYRRLAADTAPLFLDHGATRIVECWGEDVADGSRTDMKRAVRLADDETVVFSWIVYPDCATFEAGRAAMLADERMAPPPDLPFDGRRLVYGGFEVVHDTGADKGEGSTFGYVDGIVAKVPSGEAQRVAEFEAAAAPLFTERGALRLVGAVANDLTPGTTTDFLAAVDATEGDTITFGWIEWPDKATRDAGMAALMEDGRMAALTPAWDGPTAIFGGFVPIFDTNCDMGAQ